MTKNIFLMTILLLVALAAGCNRAADQGTTATASPTTVEGPDNSEITTSVDASGTKTETRTFRNNPRISKVVVTTRDGRRTVRVTSRSGEEREVTTTENVLAATGDTVAQAANFVADKAEDVPGEAKSAGKEVADKAEDVGGKAVDVSKKVGSKTVEGAKKVGDKTVEGAKKAGSAVKKVIP
ncbi:MAG TPA: hypothetical protein VFY51_03145 [Pyrinomonadaceae bacterium]|nr:hypothetical protein [Pyrinomonadaceae bacterium]